MGDYWEQTAQMFSSLFEKPKMTEKLLTKPPFKYLFDIITETRKSTGFADGLYSEQEQDAGFYEDKNRKMFFLEKVILLTSMMNGEEIEAKPNKIVAGVEPERTNEFLQAMYKAAAASGQDSGPFVQKVLHKLAKKEEEVLGRPPVFKEEAPPKKEEKKVEEPPKKKKEEPKPAAKEEPKQEKPEETKKMQRPPSATTKRSEPAEEKKEPAKSKPDTKQATKQPEKSQPQPQPKKDDDDDHFIQKEANTQHIDSQKHGAFVRDALKDTQEEGPKKDDNDGQGGIKMRKIGAAKKNQGEGSSATTTKASAGETFNPVGGSSSEAGVGDVEGIQKLIQALTQNTNPLKRSVDFVTDDIESMNKEMEYWRNQYLSSKAKYQVELKNTEEALQPLQNKCAEIEEQIKEKKLRIQNVKAQILQNEQRISNLLYSVVTTK